jgi:hypothetical protein
MLIDPKLSSYVDEQVAPQERIRRLVDGSIDYGHYDRRARNLRATSFTRTLAAIATGVRTVAGAVRRKPGLD